MKTHIIVHPRGNNYQSAFWYCGLGNISFCSEGDRVICIDVIGRVRVKFPGEDNFRHGRQAVDHARKIGIIDKTLDTLEFADNSWFDFTYQIGDSHYVDVEQDERFSLKDAYQYCQETLKDDEFWKFVEKELRWDKL